MDATAKPIKLQDLPKDSGSGQDLLDGNFQLIRNLKIKLSVVVGKCEITVGELFALKDESVVKLEQLTSDPVEVVLDGKVIAKGDLVVVENNFGVRITEIIRAT